MRAYRVDRAFDGRRLLGGGALVLVEGQRIVGVEPAAAPVPEGVPVAHHRGRTLLPGLIDTHVHLCGDAGSDALAGFSGYSAGKRESWLRLALRNHLRAGVTSVRDLGDHQWAVVERAPSEDEPTVLGSGPPITSPGGHCWFMGGQVRGRPGLADAVDERASRGVAVVKIMVSGGAMTDGSDLLSMQFDQEDIGFVVERAQTAGLQVTAHAHGVDAVEACLAAGVDGIEHGTCLTQTGLVTPQPLVERLAAAGTWVCPIRQGSGQPAVGPGRRGRAADGLVPATRLAQVAGFHAAGVAIVSGSDAGIHPGKPHGVLPHAVAELVEGGVPALPALASATSLAARACGLGLRTGMLRPGLAADLLIVDGDPTVEITDLTRVRAVVCRGLDVDLGTRPGRVSGAERSATS